MQSRVSTHKGFVLLALTPPGISDPSIAIAASRAGGVGVLNWEHTRDELTTLAAIAKLRRYPENLYGIKVAGESDQLSTSALSRLPSQIKVVILTPTSRSVLLQHVKAIRSLNPNDLTVLLEATSLPEAQLAKDVGVDGLIAKGHEAGGRVGEETTFILVQRLLAQTSLPVWAHGGVGLHTAAACYAAGAAGVVLDAQLALTRESTLPEATKNSIARMDGSETICLGNRLGETYRIYYRPGLAAVLELRELADSLSQQSLSGSASPTLAQWREAIRQRIGWNSLENQIWPIGQDAAFARSLAEQFRTVGGVLEGLRQSIDAHVRTARALKPLDARGPLARSHGTLYPIVQGPMTRVSDTASFAAAVAKGGALPLLALALMRAPEVETLLKQTSHTLGDRPWGVGILGFVPLELRQEQLEVVRAHRPFFALIAGGRPDQALSLENAGIPTYLHVPSPGLLKLFLENGARRFVFEGRECGGHVGPRSSFVLWNMMIDTLLESLAPGDMAECHVLFAGGIHNDQSACMVAALAAPLAERGVKIGVLVGTAYLFTKEAVAGGAIVEGFQQRALQCTDTILLETGPGHSIRCAQTPYVDAFEREKRRLTGEGVSAEQVRVELEELNVGRLRIASKGINRHPRYGRDPEAPRFEAMSETEQHAQGMYMIGQVAALRDSTCTIEELHNDVSVNGSKLLTKLPEPALSHSDSRRVESPSDVAIIGMACFLPKAPTLQDYWENILNKIDAISEIPEDRFDWRRYFDPDPNTRDKIYSKWGGFLPDMPFDPMRYGMPPNSLASIEPLQLLTLEVVRVALEDAGYATRPFPRQRTSVILGVGGGVADLGQKYAVRSGLPTIVDKVPADILSQLPEWTEDSFAGILLNVAAGRVANRFDLGGVNYTVDAACASSLAAIQLAVRELEAGSSDMVIVGGADTVQNAFGYLAFSKTHALSPRGKCRTFDESADGIAISEGVAVVVLKRLADAERDGDRIYGVIKGIGGSSDGRDKGLTAPRPEGQVLALERAYIKAGFSPATVGLVEAHGTGTVAGDRAEVETLKRVFGAAGAARQRSAIGSVKSMIGHTKCTAGVAGLIKIALALHHKVLPPTINVDSPNSKAAFPESPFYVNTEPRPWIDGTAGHLRRAAVSAFGFGGTNFHAVLEEHAGSSDSARVAICQRWPSELLLWSANSRQDLLAAVEALDVSLQRGARPALKDLAYSLWKRYQQRAGLTLAMVATSLEDLRQKLTWAQDALKTPGGHRIQDRRGVYFTERPLARDGKIAFLFPGQGSQYPAMLRDLAIYFPEVREAFELADQVLANRLPKPLSSYVFRPPSFTAEEERASELALMQTTVAQPALGAASMGLFRLLQALGVSPDLVAGHSYGEYVALCSAGVFSEAALYEISEARGRCISEAAGQEEVGTMAAVSGAPDLVGELLKPVAGICIANVNGPRQTVISGTRQGVENAIEVLQSHGIQAKPIPVACAFHSPLIAPARDRLGKVLSSFKFYEPEREVFSNSHAAPYPRDPKIIAAWLAEHLVSPVQFAGEVEAMYGAGARIFVEVGPRNVLTALVGQILEDRPHLAIGVDGVNRSGINQLHHLLGQLAADGVCLDLDLLYEGRDVRLLTLAKLVEETQEKPLSPTTWLVNGGRARPLHATAVPRIAPGHPTGEPNHGSTRVAVPGTAAPSPTPSSPIVANPQRLDSTAVQPGDSKRATESLPPNSAPTRVQGQKPSQDLHRPTVSSSEAGEVMLQYQRLMNQFLETQRQVMLSYFDGAGGRSGALSEDVAAALLPRDRVPAPVALQRADDESTTHIRPPRSVEPVAAPQPRVVAEETQMTQTLLQIVSERTGYPTAMLDFDLNIEADLGIDSIKWVEILGTLQRSIFPSDPGMAQEVMEDWARHKTLRAIVESFAKILPLHQKSKAGEPVCAPATPSNPARSESAEERKSTVPRFLLTAVDCPAECQGSPIVTDGVFVLTDDERGVAQSLFDRLRERGARAVLVRMRFDDTKVTQEAYEANLTDLKGVSDLLQGIRNEHGRIAGIIHLLPLHLKPGFEEMDLPDWRECLLKEVKSLFCLAKAASSDLRQDGQHGKGWLVAATSMGGAFASDSARQPFFPGHGGISGLIKTLSIEWPEVKCKVIDFDTGESPQRMCEVIVNEMVSRHEDVEVGYRGAQRLLIRARPAPLTEGVTTQANGSAARVILVTGGARGITAEVARELATCFQPTLLLVGRSPLPAPEESAETVGLTALADVKAVLMDQMRRAGEHVTPALVEAAYSRFLGDRQIRRNLAVLKETGARIHYYQADVRDEKVFGSLIDKMYETYGRIDGVIHGAGIIEDKLIEDKTPESFDRVFDTKVTSAFVLARKLRPDSLKFLVFFASVAASFGNRGQGDYAAANEVLNKLAIYLDRLWPARVVSISWGPWAQTGMASTEVQRQFAERAIEVIDPEVGRRALERELRCGCKNEAQVILGAGPWAVGTDAKVALPSAGPCLRPHEYPSLTERGAAVDAVEQFDSPDGVLCGSSGQLPKQKGAAS